MSHEERCAEEGRIIRRSSRGNFNGLGDLLRPEVDLVTPRISPAGAAIVPGAGASMPSQQTERVRGYTAQITVLNTSQMLLPADPERKFLFIQNNDPIGTCNLSFGVDATNTIGMRLAANGGGILLDNNAPTAAVFIIGSLAANSNVTMISG